MSKLVQIIDRVVRRLRPTRVEPSALPAPGARLTLAGRLLVGLAALVALGAVGSGALDRHLPLPPPAADPLPDLGGVDPAGEDDHGHEAPAAGSALANAPAVRPCPDPGAPKPIVVVLNAATEAELIKLPSVGPSKARAILAVRERLGGRFRRIEDLLRVPGIKRRSLERLRPHLVLDPPEPDAAPPSEPGPGA